MIQRLEIKNFENHRHTILDPFSSNFNLICGPSDSGKSAIVRALRLVAYNEWDFRSVRVGAKYAEITITTERGTVKVKRGKTTNEWEITPVGKKPLLFAKPGKVVIPEAAEVIGLHPVELGTFTTKPNIMDQLEGHFMLAEMDGESVSGSVRAQIIDEISGLAGMEELIREVGLDNHRCAREMKQLEKTIGELEEQKHDEAMLEAEGKLLTNADDIVLRAKGKFERTEEVTQQKHTADALIESLEMNRVRLAKCPDVYTADTKLTSAAWAVQQAKNAVELETAHGTAVTELVNDNARLAAMPDGAAVVDKLVAAAEAFDEARAATIVKDDYEIAQSEIKQAKSDLSSIPDTSNVFSVLDRASESRSKALEAATLLGAWVIAQDALRTAKTRQKANGEAIVEAESARDAAMKEVEICPICLEPVHEGCKAHKGTVAKKARR